MAGVDPLMGGVRERDMPWGMASCPSLEAGGFAEPDFDGFALSPPLVFGIFFENKSNAFDLHRLFLEI